PGATLVPYTTLFRSREGRAKTEEAAGAISIVGDEADRPRTAPAGRAGRGGSARRRGPRPRVRRLVAAVHGRLLRGRHRPLRRHQIGRSTRLNSSHLV